MGKRHIQTEAHGLCSDSWDSTSWLAYSTMLRSVNAAIFRVCPLPKTVSMLFDPGTS